MTNVILAQARNDVQDSPGADWPAVLTLSKPTARVRGLPAPEAENCAAISVVPAAVRAVTSWPVATAKITRAFLVADTEADVALFAFASDGDGKWKT